RLGSPLPPPVASSSRSHGLPLRRTSRQSRPAGSAAAPAPTCPPTRTLIHRLTDRPTMPQPAANGGDAAAVATAPNPAQGNGSGHMFAIDRRYRVVRELGQGAYGLVV